MKSINLARCERPACAKCGAFQPDCDVPLDDGPPLRMCWLCAHAVCHHDAPLVGAPEPCSCAPEEIWPDDVWARRRRDLHRRSEQYRGNGGDRNRDVSPLFPTAYRLASPMYLRSPTYMGRHSERITAQRAKPAEPENYSNASGSVPGNTRLRS